MSALDTLPNATKKTPNAECKRERSRCEAAKKFKTRERSERFAKDFY
jgi:hypothetical protein